MVWFWISTSSLVILFGPLKEDESDLYVSDLINRETCDWNKEMINKTLQDFSDDILALKPSKTGARDSYISSNWYLLGGIKICLSYCDPGAWSRQRITTETPSIGIYQYGWSPPLQNCNYFYGIQGAMPTGDNLRKRGMPQNTTCRHCVLTETTEHILFHCSFAKQVWRTISDVFLVRNITENLLVLGI